MSANNVECSPDVVIDSMHMQIYACMHRPYNYRMVAALDGPLLLFWLEGYFYQFFFNRPA